MLLLVLVGLLLHRTAGDDCALAAPDELALAERTAAAAEGCETVLFTTLYYPDGALLENPAARLAFETNGTCAVLVAGGRAAAALARHCDLGAWTLVVHEQHGDGGRRRASRLVKLAPRLFFPRARFTVFVDWKLQLRRPPRWLLEQTVLRFGAGFAAFRHPCTTPARAGVDPCDRRRPGEKWWQAEARRVIELRKTAEPEKLAAQVARLDALGPGRLDDFAEGGFVARDERDPAARRVSCAWRAAYAASGDRDQLALAEALDRGAPSGGAAQRLHGASTVEDGVLLLGADACGDLCPWDENRATFALARKYVAMTNGRGGVALRNPKLAALGASACAPGQRHWVEDRRHRLPDELRTRLNARRPS